MWKPVLILVASVSLSACSTWLPEVRTDTTTFKSFDEAKAAIEALVPMKSDLRLVEKNGFNAKNHPNTTILTHADVARRFLPSSLLRREDLDPGIIACLEARDACRGIEVVGAKIQREREGSFWADFFNFQRRTVTTGWRIHAIVLLVHDVVVYRAWSGQPVINEVEVTRNPLGPFQDIGPSQVTPK